VELTEDKLLRVADLARLKIRPSMRDNIRQSCSNILSWVEQLQKVNTDGIEPMTGMNIEALPERFDEVTDGNCVEDILANAPEKDHNMFIVPKVVE